MDVIQFNNSPVEEHLSWFQFLNITSRAAIEHFSHPLICMLLLYHHSACFINLYSISGCWWIFVCTCMLSHSVVSHVTLWTVVCLAPLSMEFSRQGYWSALPFPSPGHLPNPGIKSCITDGCFTIWATRGSRVLGEVDETQSLHDLWECLSCGLKSKSC